MLTKEQAIYLRSKAQAFSLSTQLPEASLLPAHLWIIEHWLPAHPGIWDTFLLKISKAKFLKQAGRLKVCSPRSSIKHNQQESLDKFSRSILINLRKQLWKGNASVLGQKSAGWNRPLQERWLQSLARRAESLLTFTAADSTQQVHSRRAAAASTWAHAHSSPGGVLFLQPPAQPCGRSRGQGRPALFRAPLTSDKAQSTFLARCQDNAAHLRTTSPGPALVKGETVPRWWSGNVGWGN